MVEAIEEKVTVVEETVVMSAIAQPLSVHVNTRHLQIDQRQWFVLETYGGDVDAQNLQIQIIGHLCISHIPISMAIKIKWFTKFSCFLLHTGICTSVEFTFGT